MEGAAGSFVALVCDDRPATREAVRRLLLATGFVVPGVTQTFGELSTAVGTHAARVAVVALPLTGMAGLRAVRALRERSPQCELVLLSASPALERAAVAAGAKALVPEHDLRVLRAVLLELAGAGPVVRRPRPRDYAPAVTGSVRRKPSS